MSVFTTHILFDSGELQLIKAINEHLDSTNNYSSYRDPNIQFTFYLHCPLAHRPHIYGQSWLT